MRPGELTGLCGPSGSGKSTLLSILARWMTPTAGRIEFEGIDRTGWVFQNPYGVSRRNALDHVCLPMLAAGWRRPDAEARAREVLAAFHLGHVAPQPFRELSGGEAQRLMLARAVCAAPDLLLVDEPTAQLDRDTAATVNDTLGAVTQAGTVVVIATHDPRTRAACTEVIDLAAAHPHEAEAGR